MVEFGRKGQTVAELERLFEHLRVAEFGTEFGQVEVEGLSEQVELSEQSFVAGSVALVVPQSEKLVALLAVVAEVGQKGQDTNGRGWELSSLATQRKQAHFCLGLIEPKIHRTVQALCRW
jgi:hypothetical protein